MSGTDGPTGDAGAASDRPRDMPIVDVVELQQTACALAGSELYGVILEAMADDIRSGGPCADILGPWTANALADAIPLRFLAAAHRIVLDGRAPDLARFYPSAGGAETGDPVPAFLDVVDTHRAEIVAGMHLGVQTNEVGRAASLVGAFHVAATRSGWPLRTLEVGASGGLLLRWDKYRYESGALRWGADEGLTFTDPWTTAPPSLSASVTVAERMGCDINPIDVTTDAGVLALRGFLWPDQLQRRARLDAAIDIARRFPARIEQADAGEWVERQLADEHHGSATVVYHSIVLQYLPRESFLRMRTAIEAAGARATPSAPVFWLRMEPAGDVADVRLRSWPGDTDELLATTGYHGPPVTWLA